LKAILNQQPQTQKEKQLGQGLTRVINKLTFFIFKSLFFIKYCLSHSFRCKTRFLIEQTETLNKKLDTSIDTQFIRTVISVEDKRYFLHYGHDSPSILRAFLHNIRGLDIHGASTIEQQLIRIITNDRVKTYKRKFNELLLSTIFHKKYPKENIVLIYLTYYFFSNEKVGIKQFCEIENYDFNCLSKKDICEIVARLKYPNLNQANYISYLKRVRTIEKNNYP